MVFGNLSTGYWLGAAAAAGLHWQELGRTTLGSTGDTIDVSSFTAKPYLMVLGHFFKTSPANTRWRFNSDTGSNYAARQSGNGGTDSPLPSQTSIYTHADTGSDAFTVLNINNITDKEKLVISHEVSGNVNRREVVAKWANTSNAITTVNGVQTDTGDYLTGSEVVVLGYDPADTTGTSVWEELASVDLSGGTGDSLSSGTISAKKYLWVQAYLEQSGSGDTGNICRFNSDSGSNYTVRYNENGGSDTTSTSRSNIVTGVNSGTDGAGEAFYINMFIINKSDKEKLIIGHLNDTDAGSGAGTAPGRSEFVAKWANTSGQITNITWTNSGGSATWATTSRLKVWGFN